MTEIIDEEKLLNFLKNKAKESKDKSSKSKELTASAYHDGVASVCNRLFRDIDRGRFYLK